MEAPRRAQPRVTKARRGVCVPAEGWQRGGGVWAERCLYFESFLEEINLIRCLPVSPELLKERRQQRRNGKNGNTSGRAE